MKHIIIGTAGHVDHGKTCLIKALTGVDTDRLAEERRRGITIEIGFARLTLPNGQAASVIDVPGHERFIRNMLVGASGMDVVLLVVAADEGVMPQTREHLGILSLLGVKNGIIVITKADTAEPEWLEAIMEETRENVAGTFLEDAPMVAVSAYTGFGLDELLAEILLAVEGAKQRSAELPFRLPVDRSFTKDGFGTVVTGTLTEGTISVGTEAWVYPYGEKVRVRGVQNHASAEERVVAGQRAALNLTGLGKHGVRRGDVLAAPGSLTVTRLIDVRLEILGDAKFAVRTGSRHHFFHGTRELLCDVRLLGVKAAEAGDTVFARLKLNADIAAKNGDSFVLRFFSPETTIGGGTILDVTAKGGKRLQLADADSLAARASGSAQALALEVIRQSPGLVSKRELMLQCPVTESELDAAITALISGGKAVALKGGYAARESFDALYDKADKALSEYHRKNPLSSGMNLGQLRLRLLPKGRESDADAFLAVFEDTQRLQIRDGVASLPGFEVRLSPELKTALDNLERAFLDAGLSPPAPDEVVGAFGKDAALYGSALQKLRSDGVLVTLSPSLCVHRQHYKRAEDTMYGLFAKNPQLTLAGLRDALGISRKYALALLEYWDARSITRKTGDFRILIKKR